MTLEDIQKAMADALAEAKDAAYAQGFADGKSEVARAVKTAMDAVLPASALPEPEQAVNPTLDGGEANRGEVDRSPAMRAPKGLTQIVMRQVMDFGYALKFDEIARRAVEIDSRISPKTIYNELRRRDHLYSRSGEDKWRLRPQPSTDDAQPLPIDATEEREDAEALFE